MHILVSILSELNSLNCLHESSNPDSTRIHRQCECPQTGFLPWIDSTHISIGGLELDRFATEPGLELSCKQG